MEANIESIDRQTTEWRFNGLTAASTGYVLLTGLLCLCVARNGGPPWNFVLAMALLASLTQIEQELCRGAERPAILGLRPMTFCSMFYWAAAALALAELTSFPFVSGFVILCGLELAWPDPNWKLTSKWADALHVSPRFFTVNAGLIPLLATLAIWNPIVALVVWVLWSVGSNRIESRITGRPLNAI